MKRDKPHILLVNPWIHDFAAYDVWAKPMGLLLLAGIIRQHGIGFTFIDCLDRFHPKAPSADPAARSGRGPFFKTVIPKPSGLEDIPRNYCRYGIKPEWFLADLKSIDPPDLVLVTSMMTYWYPGVKETIDVIRLVYPNTPVVLGGIYASLCTEHARNISGADRVVAGAGEEAVLEIIREYCGYDTLPQINFTDPDTWPYPAWDAVRKLAYVPLQTSRGCPYTCVYCASGFLNPGYMRRSPAGVVAEIEYWHRKYNVGDFVFYDDALLVDAGRHAIPMLEGIIRSGLKIRLHTPNALHIREISKEIAGLMFKAGFDTLRLGLETAEFAAREELDCKVTADEFEQAVKRLLDSGFNKNRIGAYLLAGLPGQNMSAVEASIKRVKKSGITPIPAYYTPIPHTALWPKAKAASRYDLETDPVFANNAILPCRKEPFDWETVSRLKQMAVAP